jgi:hypothetical protein
MSESDGVELTAAPRNVETVSLILPFWTTGLKLSVNEKRRFGVLRQSLQSPMSSVLEKSE